VKATIDFDEALYRRLKVEAARRGRTVRELVAEGVRYVLGIAPERTAEGAPSPALDWFGSLRQYGAKVRRHDLASVRKSIARGRRPPRP
jgi:hypothetical protein